MITIMNFSNKLLEDLDKRLSAGIDWNMIKDIDKAAQ